MYEPLFSDSSYGFRPKRSAHQAISKALEYYEQGYRYVVDLDLAKYFDTVNHATQVCEIRRRLQHLRQKPQSRRKSNGKLREVLGGYIEADG